MLRGKSIVSRLPYKDNILLYRRLGAEVTVLNEPEASSLMRRIISDSQLGVKHSASDHIRKG